MREPPEAIPALLASALRAGAAHVGGLLALARAETDTNLRAILRLTAILGAIPVILIATFFLGLDALVKLVALPLGSEAISALIVSAPFVVVAAALGWFGLRRMALSNLEPWRTWRQARALPGIRGSRDAP